MPSVTDYLADPEFLEEVADEAAERVLGIALDVYEAMTTEDGRPFGMIDLPPAERLLSTLDDAQRGILDELFVIAPEQAERLLSQARRDAKALGLEDLPSTLQRFAPQVRTVA